MANSTPQRPGPGTIQELSLSPTFHGGKACIIGYTPHFIEIAKVELEVSLFLRIDSARTDPKAEDDINFVSQSVHPWRARTFQRPDGSLVIACMPSHNSTVSDQESALALVLSKLDSDPLNIQELDDYAKQLEAWKPKFDGTKEKTAFQVSVLTRQAPRKASAWLKCTVLLAQGGEEDQIPMLRK